MSKRLYIDLDGVMADFERAFPLMFGINHNDVTDEVMWQHIDSRQSFFRELEPMDGAIEFFRTVEHLDPIILTACPKHNYQASAIQKRQWVREHLSKDVMVLPVLGGVNKPLFMHDKGDILIDDMAKNVRAWETAGGKAILHKDFVATSEKMWSFL